MVEEEHPIKLPEVDVISSALLSEPHHNMFLLLLLPVHK